MASIRTSFKIKIIILNKKCGNRSYRTEKRQLQLSPNKNQRFGYNSPHQPAESAFLPIISLTSEKMKKGYKTPYKLQGV